MISNAETIVDQIYDVAYSRLNEVLLPDTESINVCSIFIMLSWIVHEAQWLGKPRELRIPWPDIMSPEAQVVGCYSMSDEFNADTWIDHHIKSSLYQSGKARICCNNESYPVVLI